MNESSKSSNEDLDDDETPEKSNTDDGSAVSCVKKIITHGTKSSCDTRSAETNSTCTPTIKNATALGSNGTSQKLGRSWAHPSKLNNNNDSLSNNNNNNNCYKEKTNLTRTNADEEQDKLTKRLKQRLSHNSSSNNASNSQGGTTNVNYQQDQDKDAAIDLPISRERMESLCTIDKDELDDYLLPDNSQDQEAELLQIFQTQGKTSSSNSNVSQDAQSGVPLLENYQLYANGNLNKSQQLSELRNILAQNLQSQNAARNATAQPQNLQNSQMNRPASSALFMLSQGRNILQQPTMRVAQNPNTFVPIRAGSQTFISPRSTPVQRNHKNKPTLAPLQTTSIQFKQEFPTSAPTSPSLQQNYRYYPHALNPTNQSSQSYPPEFNRSRSVPVPQFDQPYPDSAMSSMNPTPVPSEINDFGTDSQLLNDMFSDQNPMPTVKSELITDFYSNESDEVNSMNMMSEMRSIISRSVPSTPLPNAYANNNNSSSVVGAALKYQMSNANAYKSVPTTPVNGPTIFRYTPPSSRDYLINGYSIDKCPNEASNHNEKPQSAKSIRGVGFLQQQSGSNSRDFGQEREDSMIETDIFNEMS